MADEKAISTASTRGDRGSPVPGCLILTAILVVFGGLVILYTVVGFYQNRVIGGFAEDTAAAIATAEPTEAEVEAVREKLDHIAAAVAENRAERVFFTADDLNTLIAVLDAGEGFRGNTFVESIGPEGIVASMAQPMRKGVLDKGLRYLNAVFVLQPEVRARTVAFKVMDIRPAKGSVPKGFVDSYSVLDFFRLDPDNEAIQSHAPALGAIYGEEGRLVVETRIRSDAEG